MCDGAPSRCIFCVIVPAYPSAILETNSQCREHRLMMYVWHKGMLDQSWLSKLKAFHDWKEKISGQPEQRRILSHVHPPALKPDRQ